MAVVLASVFVSPQLGIRKNLERGVAAEMNPELKGLQLRADSQIRVGDVTHSRVPQSAMNGVEHL
jgi:hypothetical protein